MARLPSLQHLDLLARVHRGGRVRDDFASSVHRALGRVTVGLYLFERPRDGFLFLEATGRRGVVLVALSEDVANG